MDEFDDYSIRELLPMKGWITWLGVAGFLLLAAYEAIAMKDLCAAGTHLAAAVALVGIGRKVEKRDDDIADIKASGRRAARA